MKTLITVSCVGLALLCGSQSFALGHSKHKAHKQQTPLAQPVPVSLNKATVAQLKKLPGIGATTAKRIVTFRDKHGHLKSLDDLLQVRGMSQHKLKRLGGRVRL